MNVFVGADSWFFVWFFLESTRVSFLLFSCRSQHKFLFCIFWINPFLVFLLCLFESIRVSPFVCVAIHPNKFYFLANVLESSPVSFFFVFLLESTRVSLQLYWSQPGCVCYMAFLQSTPVTVYFPTDFLESTSVNVLLFCWNQHSFLFPCFGINLGQFFSFCFFLAVNSVCSFCYFLQSTPVSFSLFYRELVVILISCRHVSIDVSGGTCHT